MRPVDKNNISLTKPVILLSPLDWGLGHTTRCIPLIRSLLSLDCQVIIAADARQQALLEQEFTGLQFVLLQGYRLEYGRNSLHTITKIAIQIPKIILAVYHENNWLRTFIKTNHIHAVISDNRYGFYNKQLPSVFITHQLVIKTPFEKTIRNIIQRINYHFIEKFSACWIPDYPGGNNLAGELSHPLQLPAVPVTYLGRLSRLKRPQAAAGTGILLIILSGPEPQRSIFESILLKDLQSFNKQAVLVRGLPKESSTLSGLRKNIIVHNYLPSVQLAALIAQAGMIISRSGYSTVMDLIGYHEKCIFVPTPGQTEQEYLADYLQKKQLCIRFSQKNFSLENALQEAGKFPFVSMDTLPSDLYQKVMEDFVLKLKGQLG